MRIKTRRNYDASFKVRVVLEAIKDLKTLAQLGSEFSVHPNQIRNWRNEFLEKASVVFSENQGNEKELKRLEEDRDRLHQRIGEQSMDIDFLKKNLKRLNLL